ILINYIAKWYQTKLLSIENQQKFIHKKHNHLISKSIKHALMLLILLVFARSLYQGTIINFYAFYAIDTYDISISQAQIFIFTFLILVAIGNFLGGSLAVRLVVKMIIFISLIVLAPFTL